MKIETKVTIKEKDYELLNRRYPKNPCMMCSSSFACCGCSEEKKYKEAIQPLTDSNLLEVYNQLVFIRHCFSQLCDIGSSLDRALQSMTKVGFEVERVNLLPESACASYIMKNLEIINQATKAIRPKETKELEKSQAF